MPRADNSMSEGENMSGGENIGGRSRNKDTEGSATVEVGHASPPRSSARRYRN
jgi:hypothetical protein